MSKAFTKEDSAVDEEQIPADLSLPPGVKNYLTPAGAERLRAALDEARQQLVREPQRKALHERRIESLSRRFETAEVVDAANQPRDEIRFGAAVTVDNDGKRRVYRIVGIDEADPGQGWVSWRSPVARALLGHRVGDLVTVETPHGPDDLEVLAIEY